MDTLKSAIAQIPKDKNARKDWFEGLRLMQTAYVRDVYGIQTDSNKIESADEKDKHKELERFMTDLQAGLESMCCAALCAVGVSLFC